MSETRDGGPAFPTDYVAECPECRATWIAAHGHSGMSLRDWFAGMALQGILACEPDWEGEVTMEEWAYERADRMLAAREAR